MSDSVKPVPRPTFMTLTLSHDIDSCKLWRAMDCKLNPLVIEAVMVGIAVPPHIAEMILCAFNRASGQQYKITDINIQLYQE